MRKLSSAAMFMALMAIGAPLAGAQAAATQSTSPSPSLTTQSGQLRSSQLIGSTVYDVHNRDIGSVKDIVLDRNGQVAAVVIDVGGFLGIGGKYVGVSLNDIKMDNERLTLDRSKEQLQSAEAYQLTSNSTSNSNASRPPQTH